MRDDRGGGTRAPESPDEIRMEFYGVDGIDAPVRRSLRPVADLPRPEAPSGSPVGTLIATTVAVAAVAAIIVGLLLPADDPARRAAPPAPEPAAEPERGRAIDGADAGDSSPASTVTLPSANTLPLPFPGRPIGPGRYETELLGLPLSFRLDATTQVRTARPGTVLLTSVGTSAIDLRGAPHVQFLRLAGWNSRTEATDRGLKGVGSIAPDDIGRWAADNDVIVDGSRRARVDDRATTVYEVRVDPASAAGEGICVPDLRPCFWFASVPADMYVHAPVRLDYALYGPTVVRMWLIAVPGGDPVLIHAAAVDGDVAWLDHVEATIVASLDIGETPAELLAGSGSGVPTPR